MPYSHAKTLPPFVAIRAALHMTNYQRTYLDITSSPLPGRKRLAKMGGGGKNPLTLPEINTLLVECLLSVDRQREMYEQW